MKKIFFCLLLVIIILPLSSTNSTITKAKTSEWHPGEQYFKGDYDYNADQPAALNWNRQSNFYSIDSNPNIKWTSKVAGFRGDPVIGTDGTIYVHQQDKLYAFNADGSVKWATESLFGNVSIGYDGTIFSGKTAYNPDDGSIKWSIKGYSRATPAIGESVIYTVVDNKLMALDYKDGSLIWKSPDLEPYSAYSPSPVVSSDGTIYVSTDAPNNSFSYLYAFDKNGKEKWKYQYKQGAGGEGNVPTIGSDGTIYTTKNNILYAITPNGELLWELGFAKKISQVVISKDEVIYLGSWDYNLYALNKDGSEKWRKSLNSYVRGVPILDINGNILVMDNYGTLFSVNNLGKTNWTTKLDTVSSYSSPAIAKDGTIYIGTSYAFNAVTGEKNANQSCSIYDIIDELLENPQSNEDIERAKSYINDIKYKVDGWESKINEYEKK
ncbi:PQQ-binding-like beta-propeller repeat protein [Lysinibacillus xylanilyticus]|uniref:outer membrane protein assembly factor BamB family protein n=1 Tax=Lysinibacillus xylanilyticus TaxID=582475 RepID=UPI003D010E93